MLVICKQWCWTQTRWWRWIPPAAAPLAFRLSIDFPQLALSLFSFLARRFFFRFPRYSLPSVFPFSICYSLGLSRPPLLLVFFVLHSPSVHRPPYPPHIFLFLLPFFSVFLCSFLSSISSPLLLFFLLCPPFFLFVSSLPLLPPLPARRPTSPPSASATRPSGGATPTLRPSATSSSARASASTFPRCRGRCSRTGASRLLAPFPARSVVCKRRDSHAGGGLSTY